MWGLKKMSKSYLQFIFNGIVSVGVVFLLYQIYFIKEKIVYVDSARLFNEYKGATEARANIEKKAKEYQLNIDTLTEEVQASLKSYEKGLRGIDATDHAGVGKEINAKREELARYQFASKQNIEKENNKVFSEVVAHLNNFLRVYGEKHNYQLILIANPSGTIAYAKDGLDITSEILEELNREFLKEN
jgi:outer membrane protein